MIKRLFTLKMMVNMKRTSLSLK